MAVGSIYLPMSPHISLYLLLSVAVGVYAYLADAQSSDAVQSSDLWEQSSDALYESLTMLWSFVTLLWAFALRKACQR